MTKAEKEMFMQLTHMVDFIITGLEYGDGIEDWKGLSEEWEKVSNPIREKLRKQDEEAE